jgi:hypothetical protein
MVLTGKAEEQAAIQLEMSMWMRKKGDENFFKGNVVRRRGDKRSFGGHVSQERIFSNCVDRREGDGFFPIFYFFFFFDHEVWSRGNGEQPISGPGGQKRSNKISIWDHEKWKRVMRKSFGSLMEKRICPEDGKFSHEIIRTRMS